MAKGYDERPLSAAQMHAVQERLKAYAKQVETDTGLRQWCMETAIKTVAPGTVQPAALEELARRILEFVTSKHEREAEAAAQQTAEAAE
jgi:hypothetical protein